MILVMLGTQNNSFHRLLEEIDNLIKKGIIKDIYNIDIKDMTIRYCNMDRFMHNELNT